MSARPFHYDAETIEGMSESLGGGVKATTLRLQSGDTAWNPASTKDDVLYGPLTISYFFEADGSVRARRQLPG